MNVGHTGQNKLSLNRKLVFGLSGVLLFFIITEIAAGKLLLAVFIITLFLGFTNFGRQCPLLLSLQYHINRMKSKKTKNQSQRNKSAYDKRNSPQTNEGQYTCR
jgi:Na+/H+ antiporter NhaB